MAVYTQIPGILTTEDMFFFWCDNLKKEKPHLIIKRNVRSTVVGKQTELWYEVKKELEYLYNRNLYLDEQIQQLEIADRNIKYFTNTTKLIFEMKKEIMNNEYKIKDLKKLPLDSKKLILNYTTFKKILVLFNTKAADYIIQGKTISLGNKLGYSQIRKIIPTTRTSTIDWKASMDYKKELLESNIVIKSKLNPDGKNWLVYRSSPWYLRWTWIKGNKSNYCAVANNKVYVFYPTSSDKDKAGNKSKLAQANRSDDLLHTRYVVSNMKEYNRLKKQEEENLNSLNLKVA